MKGQKEAVIGLLFPNNKNDVKKNLTVRKKINNLAPQIIE